MWIALCIFALTYLALAIGRVPGLRVDRTGAAIIGASLMIASNALTLRQAYAAIDYETIALLFGMMIVVANLRLSGFFALVTAWVVDHAHHPLTLLAGIVLVSGILSAFFVNDTVCLALTPLVLEITCKMRRNPIPYLLALAMASNAGSVATITGNPQNMMIASLSHIGYGQFSAALAPVAAVSLIVTAAVIAIAYRSEFLQRATLEVKHEPVRVHRALMVKSLAVAAAMIAAFFVGWPSPKAALLAGAILLLTRRIKPERVYREIDWSLLALFVGLFVVIAGVEQTPFPAALFSAASPLPSRSHPSHEPLLGSALESGQQRSGRPHVQIVRRALAQSHARLARAGDVLYARRQPYDPGFGRQSDRRRNVRGRMFTSGSGNTQRRAFPSRSSRWRRES